MDSERGLSRSSGADQLLRFEIREATREQGSELKSDLVSKASSGSA